jgi:hypothetical protein
VNHRSCQLDHAGATGHAGVACRSRLTAAARSIPGPNRRWLVFNALGVTAVVNVAVTLAIGWADTRGLRSVPLLTMVPWRPSTIGDTVGTTFVLPFLTTVICTPAVRLDIRRERIRPLPPGSAMHGLVASTHALVPRALRIAARTCLAVGPVAAAGLYLAHFGGVATPTFVVFKVAFAVALGAIVTPCVALAAMAESG